MESKHMQPMLREGALEGKTIIVTGGGTGLGKSMSTYFGSLGANLVITSRREEVINQAAEEINKETGAEVLAVAGDVGGCGRRGLVSVDAAQPPNCDP